MADRTSKPEPSSAPPLVLGLCGGIGSGKSTVADLLRGHGALVLDADAAARACFEEDDVKVALVNRLGPDVLGADGRVDRAAVGRRVFGADGDDSRRWLEGLVHPRVRARLGDALEAARRDASPPWCVVLDVPLLVEGPVADWCDRVVFIDAPADARRARTVRDRGWDESEVARREAAQAALDDKRARAAHILSNDGSLTDLEGAVERLVQELRSHRGSGTRMRKAESPDDPTDRGS